MKCPKCQFENREEAKFCLECGSALEQNCTHCKKSLPLLAKFCDDCGHQLEAKPTAKEQPLPTSDRERKYITALCSDMSDYTAMTEKLGPEEMKEIMGKVFSEISKVISRYDGFIEKFIGDAIMALFGATKAHEDDPVRAIKASVEIHDIVLAMSSKYEKRIGKPLTMHTGICTGLAVTSDVNLERGTHGAIGDTINIAARLSEVAKADEIVVSPATYQQAEGYFTFAALQPTTVKGKATPIKPYRVLSVRGEPTKIHRLSGLRSELVGRNVEMAQLLAAVGNLKRGKGSIFSIVGDAGTGKSRLIEELKTSLDLNTIQWREGHVYAYSQNIPYFPLMNLLSRAWQIQEGDQQVQIRQKVETSAGYIVGERKDLIPYLGSLWSIEYPEITNVGPETWKWRLHEAILLILTNLCKRAPTIICIEDLHWADPSSVELLRSILSDFRHPAIFLCVYRPSFSLLTSQQSSSIKSYCEIRLHDLSPADAQKMMESLLKTEAVPADLKKFMSDRVEGNPFYLEEVINSLVETETLVRDTGFWKLTKPLTEVNLPSTVQGVIGARLDRLEIDTKRVLREASVIGRVFLYEILKLTTEIREHIDRSLKRLQQLDIIRTRTLQPDLEYIFKHALTQEVVYNGLLRSERQKIHEKIGQVMEQLFHDRIPEFYEALAYHYKQAGSHMKAVDYLMKAGEKSLDKYALDECHSFFKEAHNLLSDKQERTTEYEKLLIDIVIKWGYAYHCAGAYTAFINLFKAHESMVEFYASKEQLAMFYGRLGFAYSRRDMPADGYQYLRMALRTAEEIADRKAAAYNCAWLAYTCADMGHLDEAIIYGEKAREAATYFESDHELFAMALGGISYVCWLSGNVRGAAEAGQALLDYGTKHSDRRCMARHYMSMTYNNLLRGDIPTAIVMSKKCIHVSPDPMTSHAARVLLGICYLSTGQLEEAQRTLREVIEHSEKFGFEWAGVSSQALVGMTLIAQGALSPGLKLYENASRILLNNKSLYRYTATHYYMGKIYSKMAQGGGGDKSFSFLVKNIGFLIKTLPFAYKKAKEHLNAAVKTADEIGANNVLGQAYLELCLLHKAKDNLNDARMCIAHAIEAFEECKADVFLKQAQKALASLAE